MSEQDTEEVAEGETIDITDVPINDFEAQKAELLRQSGVEIDEMIKQSIQKTVEDTIHGIYQRSRHGQ